MEFKIGNTPVGGGHPCFVVAELSCNHRGDFQIAQDLVEAAALAGANAVKLQIDNPDGGITIDCDADVFKIKTGPWAGLTYYQLYKYETFTPWEWVPDLQEIAKKNKLELFATPSCLEGLEYLEKCNMPAYKISSFEITDVPLIEAATATRKPVIFSDGCTNQQNIEMLGPHPALLKLRDGGGRYLYEKKKKPPKAIAWLSCASAYPAEAKQFNIKPMTEWYVQGLSDHTTTNELSFAAVALGAKIIERHFTISRKLGGPDAGFSLQPAEFGRMVRGIRNIEKAMEPKKLEHSQEWCKSIFVVRDIIGGEILTDKNLGIIRPGAGMHPKHWKDVLGKKATSPLRRGEPLREADFE